MEPLLNKSQSLLRGAQGQQEKFHLDIREKNAFHEWNSHGTGSERQRGSLTMGISTTRPNKALDNLMCLCG